MKKFITFSVISLLMMFSLCAQANYNNMTSTSYPLSGEYEIITSSLTMRDTYMLDRYTGKTWLLVSTGKGYAWQYIEAQVHPQDTIPKEYKGPAYQIVMSGIAAKGIYLVNNMTGATWVLYADKSGELFWGVVESPK